MFSSTSNDHSHHITADVASEARQPSPVFSDHTSGSNTDGHSGDYATRMNELFNDEYEISGNADADDEDESFVYTGVDAPDIPAGYADQLREVLGSELTDDDMDAPGLNIPSAHEEDHEAPSGNSLAHDEETSSKRTSSFSLEPVIPVHTTSPGSSTFKVSRSFLPLGVSRLRSNTPQTLRSPSNGSGVSRLTTNAHFPGISPSPSHISSMSRSSSRSDLYLAGERMNGNIIHSERDVFRWTDLSNISKQLYNPLTQKLSSVLGAPLLGIPTVMVANGLICIGTDQGKVCVFDFKQKLKCVCGHDTPGKPVGAVTAVALSHDHTYVASGHASGHIQLFDLKNPKVPARFVPPTTLEAVVSGRKEGHIEGSRIISVGFIAGRHTAIVSSDDRGLAFSHSLGKMLFIEAPDILRILGQYQPNNNAQIPKTASASSTAPVPDTSLPRRCRPRYTILATAPLPLGSPHATDLYNVIAMLTPSKLVVVGLKPTPRTWFKCPRNLEEGLTSESASKARGTLAWCPSSQPRDQSNSYHNSTTAPVLVFTWGCAIRLIRVDESRSKEKTLDSRTGKQSEVEVGRIVYRDIGRCTTENDILAVRWLNARIAVLTDQTLQVFDAQALNLIESVSFNSLTLVSPSLASTINGAVSYVNSVGDVAHSIQVHKGQIFLLCRNEVRVGILLTWADRILSFVKDGDFLSAINLTRSYYVGEAPGNTNGLPDEPVLRKATIGGKMKDLMLASASYTFSEDRMTDGTHITPDGRGVDRTSLFEDLVTVSCRASIALEDYEFLFEDLFQRFDDAGISKIFLRQLEPFVLNNDIRQIPPRVTQRLVALHEEDNRPDRIERIIWHIEPTCLDINQTINLCQRYHLYDALIYIYTRALRDFVAPIVELLGLIRKVQQFRQLRFEHTDPHEPDPETEVKMDAIIINAYKIYPYLSTVLSGLSYPSEEPLQDDDALRARKDVYAFVFLGRSGAWPPGEGSRLVLTADEEGGAEPTYPYVRQLLRFDAESFLHSLDIGFEDPFLNDEAQDSSRLVIVRILLEIMVAGDLSPADYTLVNIFIARNVPKYPQFFILMPPSALHDILIRLAEDTDLDTREDRQLAAEYLLSTYNPHDSQQIFHLFEAAGFYRILRSWYRQENRWGPLLSAYLDDHDLRPSEALYSVDEVLTTDSRANKGSLSPETYGTLSSLLPQLMALSIADTASLLDKHAPDLHETALQSLSNDCDRLLYLRRLFSPPEEVQDDEISRTSNWAPSRKVSSRLRQLYISLQCQQHPDCVIDALKHFPVDLVDWDPILLICETEGVYDAVVWAIDQRGSPQEALQKTEAFQKRLTQRMINAVLESSADQIVIRRDLQSLVSIAMIGVAICLENSGDSSKFEVPLEDIWFQLLSSQIHSVQALSSLEIERGLQGIFSGQDDAMITLRTLVQKTFASLVSVATTHAVSFPRLFKRLVEAASPSMRAQYTEFRAILKSMLECYRSEGDMLVIVKHLVDRDLFETLAEVVRERDRGWVAHQNSCSYCQKPLFSHATTTISHSDSDTTFASRIVVSRAGLIYHDKCSP